MKVGMEGRHPGQGNIMQSTGSSAEVLWKGFSSCGEYINHNAFVLRTALRSPTLESKLVCPQEIPGKSCANVNVQNCKCGN